MLHEDPKNLATKFHRLTQEDKPAIKTITHTRWQQEYTEILNYYYVNYLTRQSDTYAVTVMSDTKARVYI